MNYTINEVSNKLISEEGMEHLSFFYKFELKPKEEFASIELNPYVDEDKARLMAANIIAEKIANKLTYKVQKDEKYGMATVLSFSERHVETEERESYEQLKNGLLERIYFQKETIAIRTETTKYLEEHVKKQRKTIIALFSSSGLFVASALIQFFN